MISLFHQRSFTVLDRFLEPFYQRYGIVLDSPILDNYSLKILKVTFKTLHNWIIIFFSMIFSMLGIFVVILSFSLPVVVLWILVALIYFLFMEILRLKLLLIHRKINVIGLFILEEFKLVLETTGSMSQALANTITLLPPFLQDIILSKIVQNLPIQKTEEEVLLELFKKLNLYLLHRLFTLFLETWKKNHKFDQYSKDYLETVIITAMDEQARDLESWTSLLTVTITFLPFLGLIIYTLLNLSIPVFLGLILGYFLGLTVLYYYLDPFGIRIQEQSPFVDHTHSYGWSAAKFSEILANALYIDPDVEQAILEAILQIINENPNLFNEKKRYLEQLLYFVTTNQKSSLLLVNFLFSDENYDRTKKLTYFAYHNAKLDIRATILHLQQLSRSLFQIEHFLSKRASIISSELKKTFLLILLTAASMGLLIGLEPFFSVIQTYSHLSEIVSGNFSFKEIVEKNNSIVPIFVLVLYLLGQSLVVKSSYLYVAPKRLLFSYGLSLGSAVFTYKFAQLLLAVSFLT